jgi:hypothetical protein
MELDTKATLDRLNLIVAINNADDYQTAGIYWKGGKATIEAIDNRYADDIDFAHKEHKRLLAERDTVKKPVEAAVKRVKKLMADYDQAQEQARQAEARRLEAEARAREDERRLAEAIQVAATGDAAGADAILEEEVMVAPVFVPKAVPKIEGVVYREVWKFEIVNADLIPRQYLIPDEKAIGQTVRGLKDRTKIEGVRVYSERV